MAMTTQEIIHDFDSHMKQEGNGYRNWYVGITSDPRARLFDEHQVSETNGWWIFRTATTTDSARAVEDHFLALGCDGGPGGGDTRTRCVYAYRKTFNTAP